MKLSIHSDYLWFLTLTYSMIIVIANWFDARIIQWFGLITDSGTIIFPLTFLLSDLITEVYGYKHARRAIWCGFLFNAIFILYGQIVIHLPSPTFPTKNAMFDELLATNARIILASAISYLIAEPSNSLIMAKLKIKMQGKRMGFRFVASTVVASAMDSVIFAVIAFYGVMSDQHLIQLMVTMWGIKVLVEILGLPLSIKLANTLKQKEHIDIYDNRTRFNLFTLDTMYTTEDNAFHFHN